MMIFDIGILFGPPFHCAIHD